MGDEAVIQPISSVHDLPHGVEHGLRNETDTDLEILTIFTPPLF